jgi:tetratricopeptide (TPR) repeat protein
MIKLPLGLRQVLESGDCVLFAGAGIGGHFKRPDGSKAPDGVELAQSLANHFKLNTTSTDLPKVAQLVEIRKSRAELDGFVKKALANLEPDEYIKWLTTFRWRGIFTTNYDVGLERAYALNPIPPQIAIPISATADLQHTDFTIQVPIFHLHGTPYNPSPSPMVITQTDYARYQDNRRMVWNLLKNECATSTFLYVGYSGRDPNWQLILDETSREFFPSEPPQGYRIDPYADEIDVELHKARKLETLVIDLPHFKALVDAELGDYRQEPDTVNRYKDKVPHDLRDHFIANPSAMLRFLNSWEYVNGVAFTQVPNIKDFLKGSKPNWGLMAQNRRFVRDVEEDLWDWVAEFATNPAARSAAIAVTGPAGYGITTILMGLAVKIVEERIGPVFILREGAEVQEGDVAYAATLFPDVPCYFFVDQAREHAGALQTALAQQKQTKTNCLFIAGERRNEWLTARTRPKAEEFDVPPLSDPEIERLLDFLTAEKALGEMEHLDRKFQFQIVKNRHEKQLLVAMREATAGEGVGFDVIIENEYRGIEQEHPAQSLFAKELYLLVCCFYQHGVLIRDRLLEAVLSSPLHTLHQEVGAALEGLIEYTEINVTLGEYAARARHRIIAEIVWKKCGTQDKKEALLQTAMEKLNLYYRLDKVVFDKFVRSDEIVETFRTLEGKTKFFETACRNEPDNPFVLQHFARMLLRENKLSLALAQIDRAITKDKDKTIRSLHHTRGLVLGEMALSENSLDLARKRMAQAEREFNFCISAKEKDDFGYSGLANLYLGWAKKTKSENDATEYLTKAESVISEALKIVTARTAHLIISAEIQRELGDQPARLGKLREAVSSNSASVIGRYLLARAYRQQGLPQKTIEVLEPVIKTEFREVRAYIEYTRAMLEVGESIKRCSATLMQCKLDGLSDPAFVGLYGGLLYMDGRYEEAKRLWEEAREHSFSPEERIRAQYEPRDPSDQSKKLRLSGTIDGVKSSYVFIKPDDGPTIISAITMIAGTLLQRGMKVTFEPSFSAKGSYAEHVQLA